MGTWAIRLAYAVMIAGIILCFAFSRGHERDIRATVDEFARRFTDLSNYLSPMPPREHLRTELLPDGALRPLPAAAQPEAIRSILKRAAGRRAEEGFAALDAAAADIARRAGFNRTHKVQFCAPVDELLLLTQSFLRDCAELDRIDSPEKLQRFESYLFEQPAHRTVLLKRVSGAFAEEFRRRNAAYAREMERIEAAERAAKSKK